MATVQWNMGPKTIPYTGADTLTTRQAATYMAQSTAAGVWWHADWRLLLPTGQGELWKGGEPPPVQMIAPDELFGALDGRMVLLGWLQVAEVWN